MKKIKRIGILTAGGDCPGLNAAIRGVGKAAFGLYGIEAVGVRDGFLGLIEERFVPLDRATLANILTVGGTILGTSRVKPHRMEVRGRVRDQRDLIARNCRKHGLDALVCIGGGGTHKNALRLMEQGLPLITLPKTIDNDVAMTDICFGFDTAVGIATEAVDRLHSTAHSHHRIIVAEIMGHRAGWLALGAGIAGGADVILLPEIPYDVDSVAEAIRERARGGKPFSIVAVAEGAVSVQDLAAMDVARNAKKPVRKSAKNDKAEKAEKVEKADDTAADAAELIYAGRTLRLAQRLEKLTGLEARLTILGHLQRGGTPSAADRILATRLGTAAADLIAKKHYGVLVATKGEEIRAVKMEDAAGKVKTVPPDHPWILSARRVGTNFGD